MPIHTFIDQLMTVGIVLPLGHDRATLLAIERSCLGRFTSRRSDVTDGRYSHLLRSVPVTFLSATGPV